MDATLDGGTHTEAIAVEVKVEYINPFIESVHQLFTTMLGCSATRGNLNLSEGGGKPREITALIGLSGMARGTVALSFPVETALKIVTKLVGTETTIVDETVSDGVAELVNMVAGDAKARFPRFQENPIDLSLPTVVRGNSYSVKHPSRAKWLEVPFTSDLGSFSLRVIFESEQRMEG